MNDLRTIVRSLFLSRPLFLLLPRLSFTHAYLTSAFAALFLSITYTVLVVCFQKLVVYAAW
jgi:hypothetical protein